MSGDILWSILLFYSVLPCLAGGFAKAVNVFLACVNPILTLVLGGSVYFRYDKAQNMRASQTDNPILKISTKPNTHETLFTNSDAGGPDGRSFGRLQRRRSESRRTARCRNRDGYGHRRLRRRPGRCHGELCRRCLDDLDRSRRNLCARRREDRHRHRHFQQERLPDGFRHRDGGQIQRRRRGDGRCVARICRCQDRGPRARRQERQCSVGGCHGEHQRVAERHHRCRRPLCPRKPAA